MSAISPVFRAPEAGSRPAVDQRSIDELDASICNLSRRLDAETYRLLVLVREFDDRFGFAKWSFMSCAEWLAWRCQISLSAAREKVRTAQALRYLPAISAAFAKGRLSYTKVRALTRVAEARSSTDGWRAQQADALIAMARAYLAGGAPSGRWPWDANAVWSRRR